MARIIIKGKGYYPVSDVVDTWHLKERTIKKYTSTRVGKIPDCISGYGELLIPEDAFRPITRSVAQSLVWIINQFKNNPSQVPDLTELGISANQVVSVLREMYRQGYILNGPSSTNEDPGQLLRGYVIGSRGFDLVMYKRRSRENGIPEALTPQNMSLAFTAVQTVLQIMQMVATVM